MELPEGLHQQLNSLFKEYLIIGGMPAAVSSWISNQVLTKVHQIHHDLLSTYRDDFAKYAGKIDIRKLDEVMLAVPRMLGEKFMYSRINPNITSVMGKQIIQLLNKAKICHSVMSCSANGIPLGAEINEKFFKEIFLDVGLCCTATGLSLAQFNNINDITLVNKGGIAEQVVGQILRTMNPAYVEPILFYWQREGKNTNAEIDYVIQHENVVVPIEVKAGSTGALKSLHFFMGAKQSSKAVRINSARPLKNQVEVKNHQGEVIQYQLLSIPFYLLGQLHRLFKEN
jgi:predicted AAA+ superfamily ATPase